MRTMENHVRTMGNSVRTIGKWLRTMHEAVHIIDNYIPSIPIYLRATIQQETIPDISNMTRDILMKFGGCIKVAKTLFPKFEI